MIHTSIDAESGIICDVAKGDVSLNDILVAMPRTAYGEVTLRMLYEQYDWKTTWRTFTTVDAALAWCKVGQSRVSGI